MMTKPVTIAGKPLSRFYQLPFEKESRVLRLAVLDQIAIGLHSTFSVGKKPEQLAIASLSFDQGLLTVHVKLEGEEAIRVYIGVAYDCLLVSCNVDTDETYLGRYAYLTLRAMMRSGYCDFQEYYWPACFALDRERSKYVDVVKKTGGFSITLKKKFSGLFRPGDYFPDVTERTVVPRERLLDKHAVARLAPVSIGYCFANTDLLNFHTNHYPFLIPYVFLATAYLKTVKSFKRFVLNPQDVDGISLSPQQEELNSICLAMKELAAIRFNANGHLPEKVAETNKLNDANQLVLLKLWNKALPLLMQQRFTHYLYTYGMRNVAGKPVMRDMKLIEFSMEVPVLSFVLRDEGDYYELELKLKVKGKLLKLSSDSVALFLVCDRVKTYLWYLLEAEMDYKLVWFFSRVNFRVQVPKGYYKEFFEGFVEGMEKWYVVKRT
ncbi:hypothetical protein J7E50_07145 [Pedobacter sp. ISL-68]|uniref:hypothetical protein n=1 Tax=unclassified Pedobacter TaxID=2628915 RepID=UPI001BECEC35|nr:MULTISPECIES: hypothetical protein [unclassified Pedobacter]MBT2560606.1 hypothetical protein [Pedobacter sp. ISL-64]MBT2589985.1 hypothetical protein [Pedobacter sp. ISL-68]